MKKFLAAVAAASLPALVGIAGEWYEPKDWDENGLPEYSATIKFYWTDEYGEQHITKEAVKVTEDGIMDKNGNPIEVSDIASGYLDEIRNLQSSLRSSDNEIRIANIADAVADLTTNSVHETWITNWTEAVEHITYEETFQIVNCITNVTQHEDFITNVFVHEEFVTNTFNHVNMITNWYDVFEVVTNYHEFFEFQTNVWNHEEFITNVFVHEEFATNTFNNVNWITNWYEIVNNVTNYHEFFEFQTNVYYHENFVTNVFNHEEFITNTFENVNWITNWYEIVNSVTNYHEFFNFQTNVFNHEEFITNVCEVYSSVTNYNEFFTFQTNLYQHEEFITNWVETFEAITNYHEFVTFETNMFEKLHYIENWTIVTNYIVRYLGGGTTGGGGEGGEGAPSIDPQFDPYSPEYIKDDLNEVLLPVRNALMMVGITNNPMEKIKGEHMFDWDVIDTNKYQLVQLRGFDAADASKNPKMPVKRKAADITVPDDEPTWSPEHHSDYGLDWVDYPEDLVKITSSDIKKITNWLKERTTVSNILAVVSTNAEALAAMKTNLWSHVRVDTLLDNQSTWTNGAMQIEVKGYEQARQGDIPVKDYNESLSGYRVRWKPQPKPDGDAMYDTDPQMGFATYHRTLERLDDYGLMHATNVWQLYGFEAAQVGQVPAKYEDSTGNVELKWTDPASAIKFVGTDPNNFAVVGVAAKTNTVTFASAADSNVHVGVAGDGNGNVTITIGVYYLTESALTPPVVE